MKGFITNSDTADAILQGIANAQLSRNLPVYWSVGKYPIFTGPHAGKWFLPADDAILATPLMGNPVQRPTDFPECAQMIAALGGLQARVDLDPAALLDPNAPTEE